NLPPRGSPLRRGSLLRPGSPPRPGSPLRPGPLAGPMGGPSAARVVHGCPPRTGRPAGSRRHPPRRARRAGRPRTPSLTGPPTPAPGPVSPAAAGSPAASGPAANIYQWLPFSQADLTEAAGVVRQFSADYATYSYTESADRYVGRMRGLVTPTLAASLARSYA